MHHTVLLRFLAHVPLLEYRRTEVTRNIYNVGAAAFSINSQNVVFWLQVHAPKSMIIRYVTVQNHETTSTLPLHIPVVIFIYFSQPCFSAMSC